MESKRQVSSAGYRFPERPTEARPATSRPGKPHSPGEAAADRKNPVKLDETWKDLVSKERRQAAQWQKTWDFLLKYDTLGRPREEKPLPGNLSVFSDSLPKTSNQIYGSRQFTPLGKEMVRRDRLVLWAGGHRRRRKADLELQQC